MNGWLQQERELWEAIPCVPDLQCAWQVLLQCAGHLLGTLAPESSQDYAVRHDDGMFETMETLLHGLSGEGQQHQMARHIATLPMRLGGEANSEKVKNPKKWNKPSCPTLQ